MHGAPRIPRVFIALVGAAIAASPATAAQTANHGVAIGGNVNNSSVTVGITSKNAEGLVRAATAKWKNLTDSQRSELRRLELELGVTSGALKAFFATLGESNVSPDVLPVRLGEIAAQYLALRSQLQATPGNEPQIEKLKKIARDALEKGRLDQADDALRQIGEVQDKALASQLQERIETAKQRATLAMSRLRYKDAAAQFAVAERYAPDDQTRSDYERQRARTLLYQAEDFNDRAAQAEAIRIMRQRLASSDAAGQARARRDLSYALVYLGVDKATPAEVDEAMQLIDQASRSGATVVDPKFRADVNEIYGKVFCDAGALRGDPKIIKRGATAYADAIDALKRLNQPVEAAVVSLALSGCVTDDQIPNQDPRTALALRDYYFSELKKTSKESDPFEWANDLTNIAALDLITGRGEKAPDLLLEASELYRQALGVMSSDGSPERWRDAQSGVAMSLLELSKYRNSIAPLEEAIEALDTLSADARSKPVSDQRELEPYRFMARAKLGIAHNDRAMVQRALDDLRSDRFSANSLDAETNKDYEAILAGAKAFLAGQRNDPAHAKTLSLVQLEVDLPSATAEQSKARTASFAAALKTVRRCRDASTLAKSLGATMVVNDEVPTDKLPQRLRDMLAVLDVGSATQLFSDSPTKARSLILCGRKWEAATAK